jgi:ribose transport system substrate-binding protein
MSRPRLAAGPGWMRLGWVAALLLAVACVPSFASPPTPVPTATTAPNAVPAVTPAARVPYEVERTPTAPGPVAEASPDTTSVGLPTGAGSGTGGAQSHFFNNADYEQQLGEESVKPDGPDDQPWLQAIDPTYIDTSKYKKGGPWTLCFSNASLDDPWRAVGWTTMQAEASSSGDVTLNAVNADGADDKQIADLADLATQRCDVIIVSPNTTAALTPAVQKACDTGVPIVVFDRSVDTECPVTFIHPIGGYAFGATAADFIASNLKKGGNVLALRTVPDVDTLETRWSGAKVVFDQRQTKLVGVEFTGGDPTRVQTIVKSYIQRYGSVDGLWMDAGATATAAIQAFHDAGKPVPPMSGEDQQDFLRAWKSESLTAIAPTYPTYQWRTAIIAARLILNGQKVPKEWVLPQPVITSDNLDEFLFPNMPDTFYSLCGCQKLPGYPERWGGTR